MQDFKTPGRVLSIKQTNDGITFITENGSVQLKILADDIINIRYREQEKEIKDTPAVVGVKKVRTGFSFEETEESYLLQTEVFKLKINKSFWNLGVYDLQGREILQDYKKSGICKKEGRIRSVKSLSPQENFYGLGERTGFLNKRGEEHELWNFDQFLPHVPGTKHMYKSIPFLIGLKEGRAYGIYFDNSFKTRFNLGAESEEYFYFEADGGSLNYYIFYGPEMSRVVKQFTEITGRMELPPLWSLGYQQCRYSYCPQDKVEEVARNFREKQIPCDVIYLDIHHMDGFRVFTWDREKYPSPKEMLSKLKKDGFRVVTIVDPGIKKDPDYRIYNELMEKDYYCKLPDGSPFVGKVWPGDSVFPDFSRSEVRDWWKDKNIEWLEEGIDGIWNDMNEPAVMDREDKTMPLEVRHENEGQPMEHREFHNLYGLMMCKATREAMDSLYPDRRKFILTRAAFAGIQRYSAGWTGDNRSYWEHLSMSIPMLQNLSLSGVAFCGADIGGFSENASPELFVRWMQAGVFYPLARAHSAIDTRDHEPWSFGETVEEICRKYIGIRYQLLPYLYNQFKKAELSGEPIFRPLVFDYQDDPAVYDLADQFLIGSDILVAPVLLPGKRSRAVYLPAGRWYDFHNNKVHEGPGWILADAPLDIIPIFVRAGSIIPVYPVQNHTGEITIPDLTFRVYPGNGWTSYYEDDGISYGYKDGVYNLLEIEQQEINGGFKLKIKPVHLGYSNGREEIFFEIQGLNDRPVKRFSFATDKLRPGSEKEIKITF